jgi:hypothetical protein
LEISPHDLGVAIGSVILVISGMKGAQEVRRRRNGHHAISSSESSISSIFPVQSSAASLQLAQRDMEWRKSVDDDVDRLRRDMYESAGAVRGGDVVVRDELQRMTIGVEARLTGRLDKVDNTLDLLGDSLNKVLLSLAHGHHCSHCPRRE